TPAMSHPDIGALEVMSEILSGRGGIGRLDKAIVDTKKALSVRMSIEEMHDPGVALVSATLNDEQSLDEVKKALLDTLGGLSRQAPTEEEVRRAKLRITQNMDRVMANSQQFGMQLNEFIADGDWRLFFTNYEEVRRVTAEDVVRVAKLYFKDSNRTVGMFIP